MSELRRDPITQEWVLVTQEAEFRPTLTRKPSLWTPDNCPFCPGQERLTPPEIMAYRPPSSAPNAVGWRLRVIPSRRPLLRVEEEPSRSHEGLLAFAGGVGAHEVVIESAAHDKDWFDFSAQELWEILLCWRERLLDLRRDRRLRHAVIVRSVGVTPTAPAHPHSQIIALPFWAPELSRKMEGARRYFEEHDRCAFCDLIAEESRRELRVVVANDDIIALAPYASRRPFELWLSVRRHIASFEATEPQLLLSFAAVLRGALQRLARALDRPAYLVTLHSAPYAEAHSASFHWHLEISPALAPSHALESFGCAVNPTAPETVAAFLREVIV